MPTIRLATEADAEQVQAIYAPFCEADSHVSFEVEPPTIDEIRRRIARTLERFPWLVCDDEGEVVGYAYAGPHNERAAYGWSVNVSVYIRQGRRGAGIGRALYTSLFAMLKLQGFVNAFAGATLPNPASEGLHLAMGFKPVGIYHHVGFKAGAWHDTVWWHLPLREPPPLPDFPITLAESRNQSGWGDAMDAGLSSLRPG